MSVNNINPSVIRKKPKAQLIHAAAVLLVGSRCHHNEILINFIRVSRSH